MPSMRRTMQDAVSDFKTETAKLRTEIGAVDTAASDRLDRIEQADAIQAARQEGVMTVIRWAGGTSLLTMVGVIVALIKLLGGHA